MAASALLTVGLGAASAITSSNASKSAANAQTKAAADANATQLQMYNQTRSDLGPYRQAGYSALERLQQLNGLASPAQSQPLSYQDWTAQNPMQGTAGSTYAGQFAGLAQPGLYQNYLKNFKPSTTQADAPDYSSFYASPDYNFARTEGQRGVEQSAAARGGAASGNALKALSQYNQGLASQQYGNYYNRISQLAGFGQNANQTGAQSASNYANMYGQNALAAGDARASGLVGSSNAWSGLFNGLAGWMSNGLGG